MYCQVCTRKERLQGPGKNVSLVKEIGGKKKAQQKAGKRAEASVRAEVETGIRKQEKKWQGNVTGGRGGARVTFSTAPNEGFKFNL